MEKTNLELFKEALNEALDNKIRREVESCTEEIITSERHKAAMQAILDGTYEKKSVWKLTKAKVAAILVAATLLLASCAVIYRNEIRDFVEEIFADFTELTYSDKDIEGKTIETAYSLTYVPEGYALESTSKTAIKVRYEYRNANNDFIIFEQRILDTTKFAHDIENSYSKLISNNEFDIYYKSTRASSFYIWNDGYYSLELHSNIPIPDDELINIINGITE
jgi:hypothetical protein